MTEPKNHRVEGLTCNGDRFGPLWVTEAEASFYDTLPFDDAANVAATTITKEYEQ